MPTGASLPLVWEVAVRVRTSLGMRQGRWQGEESQSEAGGPTPFPAPLCSLPAGNDGQCRAPRDLGGQNRNVGPSGRSNRSATLNALDREARGGGHRREAESQARAGDLESGRWEWGLRGVPGAGGLGPGPSAACVSGGIVSCCCRNTALGSWRDLSTPCLWA